MERSLVVIVVDEILHVVQLKFLQKSGNWGLECFSKPNDTHALLHKNSFHPDHAVKGIVKSQLIRFHSKLGMKVFQKVATTFFSALKKRGYGHTFLRYMKSEVESGFGGGTVDQSVTEPLSGLRVSQSDSFPGLDAPVWQRVQLDYARQTQNK
ncbi:hypothetical protein JOB18_047639 [Solea senegalensis]|uniref:Uncharacterized protein n=1 Tax=Solea senegalensis TaxID=28829 RepID=A0AAV6R2X7_SOLSE|nr:hypothetical protein JOB18_047639 [Solea senegalensis]